MPNKLTEVSNKLSVLLAVPVLDRGASESERFAAFLEEIKAVIVSDPDVLCYIGSMYKKKAQKCLPILQALGLSLAEAIVEKNAGTLENDRFQQYVQVWPTSYQTV